jgi:hypothetical protein
LEAAEALVPFTNAAELGWAWGNDDEAIIYELKGRGVDLQITLGQLRQLRAAVAAAKGEQQ